MSDNAIRTNGRGLLLAYDDTDIVFGPIHISIQDAVLSPERVSARCDEFQEWAELVPALQDDARSIAEKARKSLVHLLPRLAGDGKALRIDDRPLHDFKDHITNCEPSKWYGWQFLAAMKTVGEIMAKAGNSETTYSPGQLMGLFRISDETLRRYAKAAHVNRPGRGQGRNFQYTSDDARLIAQKIINSKTDQRIKEHCQSLLNTFWHPQKSKIKPTKQK